MFGASFILNMVDVIRDANGDVVATSPVVSREYHATPIDLLSSENLDLWVRQRRMQAVEISCKDMTQEARLAVLVETAKAVSLMSWTDDDGVKMLSCVDGMTALARAALYRHHPDLTRESLRELLCYPDNWRSMLLYLNIAANVESVGVPHPTVPPMGGQQTTLQSLNLTPSQRRMNRTVHQRSGQPLR